MARNCGSSVALLLLFFTACTTPPPTVDTVAEADAIRARFADWVAAENRRDLEASISFLTSCSLSHWSMKVSFRDPVPAGKMPRRGLSVPQTHTGDLP